MVVKVTHRVHPVSPMPNRLRFLQLDQKHDLGDIRRATSAQWHTDYLVDVCPYDNGPGGAYDPDDRKLDLLAGTNGQVLFPVSP